MPKKLTKEEFEEKARAIHGDKYDYDHVDYKNNKTEITIVCPEHGSFPQTPNSHLDGQGCPYCSSKKLTTKEFKKRAREIHGYWYNYDYVEYKDSHTKVTIVCPEHGSFPQTPNHHLDGQGCPSCGTIRTSEKITQHSSIKFIDEAREVHGNKYNYDYVDYQTAHTLVTILCPEHGPFEQTPNNHLSGKGCPDCAIRFDHYMLEKWLKENPKRHDEKCLVYLIRIYNDNEDFLKLGITSKDNTNKRFSNTLEVSGYSYEIIAERQTTKKNAILIEKKVKESFNLYSYSPLSRFSGWTECFLLEAKDQIEEMITCNIGSDYSSEKVLG